VTSSWSFILQLAREKSAFLDMWLRAIW